MAELSHATHEGGFNKMSSEETLSAATILSSTHGRMRRAQRLIDKRDLQAALKYGECEETFSERGERRLKYTFADIVYITDETSTHEITCWAKPGAGLDVEKHPISKKAELAHKEACERILMDTSSWTSHTVIVVDQSGSMRKADVAGGATRSDAVWISIAIDFIAKQLETKKSSDTDVVSIVAMGISETILVDRKPHDWILFNTVVDLLRKQEPVFDGNYLPALDAAEKLLIFNSYGSCILSLFFLSDGKPSDNWSCVPFLRPNLNLLLGNRIDTLASRFGRRLSVITVGFAGPSEDFSVLQHMASRPAQFDSNGCFLAADLNAEALGNAFSSITSSINQTRSELTAIGGSTQRTVRDVMRRAKNDVGLDLSPNNQNWFPYKGVDRLLYSHKNPKDEKFKSVPPMNSTAQGIALANKFFGEGAERLVREFREIGPDGMFIGPKLVAKESRFVMDVKTVDRNDIKKFHETFCNTQERAQGLAQVFNARLEKVPGYDAETTPKISFLECSTYMVHDKNFGLTGMLVEKQLDPTKYKKWNDNCGAVDGHNPLVAESNTDILHAPLDMIAESDEESEEDSEDKCDEQENGESFCVTDIPQAFSHFTYRYTRRKLLVCDLQGVLSTSPPLFELTDPVIHFISHRKRTNIFGRTDRGWKGRNDFFRTHKCSPLCDMINHRWVRKVGDQQRSSHTAGLEERISNLHL